MRTLKQEKARLLSMKKYKNAHGQCSVHGAYRGSIELFAAGRLIYCSEHKLEHWNGGKIVADI